MYWSEIKDVREIFNYGLFSIGLEVTEENITRKPIWMKTYEYFYEKRSFLNKFTFK